MLPIIPLIVGRVIAIRTFVFSHDSPPTRPRVLFSGPQISDGIRRQFAAAHRADDGMDDVPEVLQ